MKSLWLVHTAALSQCTNQYVCVKLVRKARTGAQAQLRGLPIDMYELVRIRSPPTVRQGEANGQEAH
jgi:hypothetical protein